ncbi:MAG: nitroreductase family protein [Eubacteriales bacterium]
MMERIEKLLTRRSIRSYKDTDITQEELNAVLEAGRHAPSGMSQHKVKFAVCKRGKSMDKIISDMDNDPFYGAKTLVIVFVDKGARTPMQDGCLALGNMMNAAHMVGLGSCWVSSAAPYFESEKGKNRMKEWKVPDEYFCVGAIVLGYQEGEAMPRMVPDDLYMILD